MINHYRTLGVDPQAEAAVIRRAYLALMRRHHPDGGGEEADASRAQAVTAAWDVLRDPARRAAYDETRQARFEPDVRGGAVIGRGSRVRGGAAGRNLFLLLAAATVGLGWWSLQQPLTAPPVKVASAGPVPALSMPEVPAVRPAEDERTARRRMEAAEIARYEAPPRQPEVEEPVIVAPLAPVEQARLPVRTLEARAKPDVVQAKPIAVAKAPPARPFLAAEAPASAPQPASIDLAPLERHLQLLTDQSLRYGTEAKRSRLLATRETFLQRLRTCDDDACRRDAYLTRNQEVAAIMQR